MSFHDKLSRGANPKVDSAIRSIVLFVETKGVDMPRCKADLQISQTIVRSDILTFDDDNRKQLAAMDAVYKASTRADAWKELAPNR